MMLLNSISLLALFDPHTNTQIQQLTPVFSWPYKELGSLFLAAVLGTLLAFRIPRPGVALPKPEVIHAQILLAVIGTLVMVIIGESMARAFGIVGVAGLVRYRAKINPKDGGIMLSALGIGLAVGVGLYSFAIASTLFIWSLLAIIDVFYPPTPTEEVTPAEPGPEPLPEITQPLAPRPVRLHVQEDPNHKFPELINVR